MLPKLYIGKNIELDTEIIKELAEDENFSNSLFVDWNKDTDIKEFIANKYIQNEIDINKAINGLEGKRTEISTIMNLIAEIMETDWDGIPEIHAYVGFCPIQPRFLDTNSFILRYDFPENLLLHFPVHEIIHFLYFKKWQELFPESSEETFEYPHQTWILSEILAPVIMRDPRIINIIKSTSGLYDSWQKVDKSLGFFDKFYELYTRRKNFSEFLTNSRLLLEELNKKKNLCAILLDKTM